MQYVCLDCQHVFDESKHYVEKHGLNTSPYEEFYGCPECGGAYTEAFECDCCGEIITSYYVKTKDGRRYCEECVTDMEIGDEDV